MINKNIKSRQKKIIQIWIRLFQITVIDQILPNKKYLKNQIRKMKVGLTLPLQAQFRKIDMDKMKKMMRTIKIFRKSCSKDWKTRATFILKKTYFQ